MELRVINPPELYEPVGYSQIVTVAGGTTVYIAGQVSFDESGALVGEGDLAAQAEGAYANLGLALAAVDGGAGKRGAHLHLRGRLRRLDAARAQGCKGGLLRRQLAAPSTLFGVSALAMAEIRDGGDPRWRRSSSRSTRWPSSTEDRLHPSVPQPRKSAIRCRPSTRSSSPRANENLAYPGAPNASPGTNAILRRSSRIEASSMLVAAVAP